MSTTQATYSEKLTTYAAGLAAKRDQGIADFVFPRVQTGVATGKFRRYSGKNAFQIYDTLRALGSAAARVKMEADDPYFHCQPNALAIAIDDFEREEAGTAPEASARLEEAKIATLVSTASIARELRALDKINTITPEADKGGWSSATADPIAELDAVINGILSACGVVPNRIALGLSAWTVLRNHPKVVSRVSGISAGVSIEAFRAMLSVPLEIRVGSLGRDTAKFGKDKKIAQIVGAKALIFCGEEYPSTFDPSFGKTFTTAASNVDSVRFFRDESATSDIYQLNWSEDIQIAYTEAAALIAVS
jgi:hypothetical protein